MTATEESTFSDFQVACITYWNSAINNALPSLLCKLFATVRFKDGLNAVNDSRYGLQAGVFTNNLKHAFTAFESLEVGGVIINDVPAYRVDHMPYGGVKMSGFGREGIKYAIEEMTEIRLMALNPR